MSTEGKITELFVMAEEFCKIFDAMFHCRNRSTETGQILSGTKKGIITETIICRKPKSWS